MNKHRSKGIVLVTTLFVLMFVVMLAGAVMVSSSTSMKRTRNFNHREQAHNAAISGMEYARMRLSQAESDAVPWVWQGAQKNPSGSGYLAQYTPEDLDPDAGFNVVEHHVSGGKGWVEGTITGDEAPSKFYIFFASPPAWTNFQYDDDLVGTVRANYLSVNNTRNIEPVVSKLVTGDDNKEVPFYSCYVVVKGIAQGETRYMESMLLRLPDERYDSVAISQKDVNVKVNNHDGEWFVSSMMGLIPLIRSNAKIDVESTHPQNVADFVNIHNAGKGRAKGNVTLTPPYKQPVEVGLLGNQPAQDTHIPSIQWSDLAYGRNSTPVELAAGTYVFRRDEDSGELIIDYYDTDGSREGNKFKKSYVDLPENDVLKKVFAFETDRQGNIRSNRVLIREPISITRVNASKGEWTYSSTGITLQGDDSLQLSLKMDSTPNKSIYIQNNIGSVRVDGELTGSGAIYAQNDIVFEGRSQLSADTGTICLFAQGDIILNDFSKPYELDTDNNPSKYLAEGIKTYLDNLNAQSQSEEGKISFTLDNDAVKSIRDIEIEGEKLKDILADESLGYGYDKQKQEELIIEMIRNTADDISGGGGASPVVVSYNSSTYTARLDDIASNPDTAVRAIQPNDQVLGGVVYSGGDFVANLGVNRLTVQGALISRRGKLYVNAGSAAFIYNPKYLGPLYQLGNCSYKQLYWGSFDDYAGKAMRLRY